MKLLWITENDLKSALEVQERHYKELLAELKIEQKPLEKDAYERLADLEVKMHKLWSLLVNEENPGRPKLTKFGRLFGGRSKTLQQ